MLGGAEFRIDEIEDPREVLMDWMRDEANPYFARAIVNRVWASYFNVGIVEPPDDLSLADPPSNEPLLDHLATGFRIHGFDLKWLHREIANSRTYQTSWRPNETNQLDERNFARAVGRRTPAEVASDAVKIATASDGDATKMQATLEGSCHRRSDHDARWEERRPDGVRPLDPGEQLRLRPLDGPGPAG